MATNYDVRIGQSEHFVNNVAAIIITIPREDGLVDVPIIRAIDGDPFAFERRTITIDPRVAPLPPEAITYVPAAALRSLRDALNVADL